MRNIIILSTLLLMLCACKSETVKKEVARKKTDPALATKPTKSNSSPNKYNISPFTSSPAFNDAKIESMSYKEGKFDFKISGESYKLGVQTPDAAQKMCANSGKGQHIHLIVDNEPYAAKYVSNFEHDVADGEHYLLAFLSRSYHESIKTKDAAVVKKINVKDKSIVSEEDVKEPILFYSRPKGTYIGKANTDKVMLDFYVANADALKDYRIHADINGENHIFSRWIPYYIEGLPMGENVIKLTLMNRNNENIDTPLGTVTRTFTLKADPAE